MTFENIILGSIIVYLIYKIYRAIKNTPEPNKEIKLISSMTGKMVKVKLDDVKNPMQLVSTIIEQDFPTFAKMAFSRISQAFASGIIKDIKNEVSPKVFDAFTSAIEERIANKYHVDYTLIGFVDTKITNQTSDTIVVEFTTEQINLLKDETQKVIEGDPMHVATVKEQWTFNKVANNWVLSAVKAGEGHLA